MVEHVDKCFEIGDLVRMARAHECVGLVTEVSDAWTRGRAHHVRVCWVAGEPKDTPWLPVKELEIISKIGEKKVDNK